MYRPIFYLSLVGVVAIFAAPWLATIIAALFVAGGMIWVAGVLVLAAACVFYAVLKTHRDERKRNRRVEIKGARKSCPHCQCEVSAHATYCMSCEASC